MLVVYQELGHNPKWHFNSDDYASCPTLPLASTRPSHISRSPYAALKKKKKIQIQNQRLILNQKATRKSKKMKPEEKANRPLEKF